MKKLSSGDIKLQIHRIQRKNKKSKKLSSFGLNIHKKSFVNNTYWQEMKVLRETIGDKKGQFCNIKDAWKNEPCFIIGTSRAIEGFDFNLLNGFHTIGINHLIEDWDLMEWFIYLDERFIKKTTYDLNKFKGKVFGASQTNILQRKNYIRFKQISRIYNVDLNIQNGLFGKLTGVCAIHLALISGANPIYLLGMDTKKEHAKAEEKEKINHHYKSDYTWEIKTGKYLQKYVRTYKSYLKFSPWKNRIINVCIDGTAPDIFKRISQEELKKEIKKLRKEQKERAPKEKVICHVTNFEDINRMNELSRQIFSLTEGKHIRAHIDNKLPDADIYLLECILRDRQKFVHFKPHMGKLISLIHSRNVFSKYSDKCVVLTKSQKIGNDVVIPCAIDMKYYQHEIDYNNKVFGRITPYSTGKVHPKFNEVANNIMRKVKDSKCLMISNNVRNRKDPNIEYIEDIGRHENKKKAKALSRISIFADMHNTYLETFSISLLEAMASGHAIVLYSKIPQDAMTEVLGDAGIICKTIQEFEEKVIYLLENPKVKKGYGLKAKERARLYSIENLVKKWNLLFKEL
jgi:glycosyltransferase involved in cell wall biosynthesis